MASSNDNGNDGDAKDQGDSPKSLKTFTYNGQDEDSIPNDVQKLVAPPNDPFLISEEKWMSLAKLCHLEIAGDSSVHKVDFYSGQDDECFLPRNLKMVEMSKALGIRKLACCCFLHCNVKSISLPPRLEEIGLRGLANCDIVSILIPESTTAISEDAFGDCNNLKTALFQSPQAFSRMTTDYFRIIRGKRPANRRIKQVSASEHELSDTSWYGPFDGCNRLTEIQWPKKSFDILLWPRLFWHYSSPLGALAKCWGLQCSVGIDIPASTNRNSCLFNFLRANVTDFFNKESITANRKKCCDYHQETALNSIQLMLDECASPNEKQERTKLLLENLIQTMDGATAEDRKRAFLQLAADAAAVEDTTEDDAAMQKRLKGSA